MSSKRPDSSYASSSVGLHPFHLNPNNVHSQTWTLVNEFYMGGRQQRILDPHESWKYDLECQISTMEDKVRESQEEFPDTLNNSNGHIKQSQQRSVRQVQFDFEKRRLESGKNPHKTPESGTPTGCGNTLKYGVDRDRQGTDRYHPGRQTKIASVLATTTEAHLGRMDTTFHGAVLGPNTGRSFNTGM